MAKRYRWYWLEADEFGGKGWWCYEAPPYSITITTPKEAPFPKNDAGPFGAYISIFGQESNIHGYKKYRDLESAKQGTLNRLAVELETIAAKLRRAK